MKPEDLVAYLLSKGYVVDSYGHYHKGEYRFKFQKTSVRYERSYRTPDTEYSKGEKRWIPVVSGYFKNLSIVDGKISGLKRQ